MRVAVRDLDRRRPEPAAPRHHLLAAEAWLCRAHDASKDGGVSYGYTLRGGWRPSYPETSGYIASTFFRLARVRDPSYLQRARRIVRWLLSVQNRDGSFANARYGPQGIVFDTGQVLFGLVCGYRATGDVDLLLGARKAAAWLTQIVGADLRWTRNEHLNTPHVYNTRTAWALLQMNELEFDPVRAAVARSNLDWAVDEQLGSGFFNHCAFRYGDPPFTHTIAYTARGLLESGLLLQDRRYVDAAVRCADATLAHLGGNGFLPGAISTDGRAASTSCCLTGNCQFAIIWSRLCAEAARPAYESAANRALAYVMSAQDLTTTDADVRGGIKGSHPVWGRYAPMSFPNWAAKFFVDAMWLRPELQR
ncbi:MAG: terpene cyclase/mutase family protein [Pseudomonadota bacterium]|nr:terpene cyclase/mutase family protein [Pseudomonadota bacterium]